MSSSHFHNIERLNPSNYPIWKIQMEMVLVDKDMWEIVNGTLPRPQLLPTTASQEAITTRQKEITDWDTKAHKIRSTLMLAIEPSEYIHIQELRNPREIWNTLQEVYKYRRTVTKHYLLRSFYTIKYKKGSEIL